MSEVYVVELVPDSVVKSKADIPNCFIVELFEGFPCFVIIIGYSDVGRFFSARFGRRGFGNGGWLEGFLDALPLSLTH